MLQHGKQWKYLKSHEMSDILPDLTKSLLDTVVIRSKDHELNVDERGCPN